MVVDKLSEHKRGENYEILENPFAEKNPDHGKQYFDKLNSSIDTVCHVPKVIKLLRNYNSKKP